MKLCDLENSWVDNQEILETFEGGRQTKIEDTILSRYGTISTIMFQVPIKYKLMTIAVLLGICFLN